MSLVAAAFALPTRTLGLLALLRPLFLRSAARGLAITLGLRRLGVPATAAAFPAGPIVVRGRGAAAGMDREGPSGMARLAHRRARPGP